MPIQMPPQAVQPQPQQRFFNNGNQNFNGNENFNGNQNFNNQNRFKPLPHYQQQTQQRQPSQQQQQQGQAQGQAPNPFIPLQASRKATKAKNIQSEPKKAAQQKQAVAQQKELKNDVEKNLMPLPAATSQIEADVKDVSVNQPAVDNRKCRLAISFGK